MRLRSSARSPGPVAGPAKVEAAEDVGRVTHCRLTVSEIWEKWELWEIRELATRNLSGPPASPGRPRSTRARHLQARQGSVGLRGRRWEGCAKKAGRVASRQQALASLQSRTRHRGRRPHVRGTAKNPVAHPLGGGEGRSGGGRHPCSPTGVPAKGGRRRARWKTSNRRILRRRNSKRYGQLPSPRK